MQGRSDIPLDDHGRAQADAAGRALAVAVWDGVVSSPLARARQTAAIIAAHLPNLSHDVDARLGERDYGEAEGLAVADAYERWPSHDFPRSESIDEVAGRGAAALRELVEEGRNAVVVAHGTLLRLAIGELTGNECPRILNGETLLLDRVDDRFLARRLA